MRHLGYLLAEAAVSPDLDAGARRPRRCGSPTSLTGRQLALLAGVGRRERMPLPMAPLPTTRARWSEWGAREDVADLQRARPARPAAGRSPGPAAPPSPGCARPTCG